MRIIKNKLFLKCWGNSLLLLIWKQASIRYFSISFWTNTVSNKKKYISVGLSKEEQWGQD